MRTLLPLAALAAPVQAQTPVEARAAELPAILNGAGDAGASFAPAFLANVPAAQIAALAAQLRAANGAVTGVEAVEATSPHAATVRIGYARAVAVVEMAVDPSAPHRIVRLLIKGTSAREATLDAVAAALAALPGTTGFLLARLDGAEPVPVMARNETRAFAIGSEFKLVILAELVRAVAAGERRWGDEVVLDGSPLPGGGYTLVPAGGKVTLKELAQRMIAVSDNSATDILLRALGREKVEAMLPVVGIARPAGMRPFLGTLEVFKLKGVDGGSLGRRWAAADEAGRRALLAGDVAKAPIGAIDGTMFAAGKPIQIDTAEWFATPADMVRVMDWLRRNTETGPAAEARAILSANPGVGAAASAWRYVGYKGGSEPGVIAMTFLLQGQDGAWYAMSASWNDPATAVDDARFASLLSRAVELAAAH
jgi:beta-lactamase class A